MPLVLLAREREKALDDRCDAIALLDDAEGELLQLGILDAVVNQLRVVNNPRERIVDSCATPLASVPIDSSFWP